jgi:hypothetical protein
MKGSCLLRLTLVKLNNMCKCFSHSFFFVEWGADDTTIFYTTCDDLKRSNKLWKHTLGEDVVKDDLMYEEKHERYERALLGNSFSLSSAEALRETGEESSGKPLLTKHTGELDSSPVSLRASAEERASFLSGVGGVTRARATVTWTGVIV